MIISYHAALPRTIRGRVLSVHRRAVNFVLDDGEIATLVTPEVGNGPGAIVVDPLHLVEHLDGTPWTPPPPPVISRSKLPPRPVTGLDHPLFATAAARGIAHLAAGRWAEGAAALAGLGPGLTPSGDDLLCGYAVALHRTGHPAAPTLNLRLNTTPLSQHFLKWAARGVAGEHHLAWLDSVLSGNPLPLGKLMAHGATSGADWAAGALLALAHHCGWKEADLWTRKQPAG